MGLYLVESNNTVISATDFGVDPGDRASAGSSGIASLPWSTTDHDASSSGTDNSTCSSSKLRCKMTPNKTKCLVEVTPEHSSRHCQSPAISGRLFHHVGNNKTSTRHAQDVDEDLIQRVSEFNHPNCKQTAASSRLSSFLPKKSRQHCDQDFIQLCALVKDKLNHEGISLAAPPFTTKVSFCMCA